MRMKTRTFFISLIFVFLFCTIGVARELKVTSRMSYYTHEKTAEIIVYLPEGEGNVSVEGDNTIFDLHSGVNLIPVKAETLHTGDNKRTVTITRKNGIKEDFPVNIIRLTPKTNEVKIDRLTGNLLIDGWQWLPVGFYSSLKDHNYEFLRSEVTQGINLYSPYHTISAENQDARMAYLDLCAQLGIKVNYNVCSLAGSQGVGLNVKATPEEKYKALKEEILRVKDHPALLSYYIADEPDGQGVSPELLKQSYDLIHELDPYHPVSVVIISSLPARRYAGTYDIIMADPYPVPNAPATEAPRMIREIYEQMCYEKAVWLVPQVFGGGEIWTREPSAREVRLMIYGSILAGARGIQGFHRMPDSGSPLLWNGFKEVAVELQQIAPYLYDPNPQPVSSDKDQITACAYRRGDNLLIIAQNTVNNPLPVTLSIPEIINGTAKLIFENRKVQINDGQITDILPPFGTGVYKIALKEQPSAIVSGNLLVNPSFEESVEAGEMTGGSGGAGGKGATLFPDPRIAYDGEISLRLNNPFRNAGASRSLFPIDNESDRTYILSVWARTDARSLAENKKKGEKMTFKLSLNSLGEEEFELTDTWKKYELICPPKAYKRTHHGGASGAITLIGEGTVWFDLAQITPEISISTKRTEDQKGFIVSMESYLKDGEIRYTTDGSEPAASSLLYEKPFEVRSVQTITARVYAGGKAYATTSQTVAAHKALDAKVTYLQPYHPKYSAGGDNAMTDGKFAPLNAQAPLWHGYLGNDIDLVVDLGSIQPVHRISLGFLQSLTAWVMPPKELEVLLSNDGEKYRTAGKIKYGEARQGAGEYDYIRVPFVISKLRSNARYVRIKAKHPKTLPSWYRVQGESWMFIDEVVIE
ncbi:hypothetical protein DW095_05365 [Bacteroides sp. AM07-16]|nr:hypothetical protein DW095_05365 [Bacteroides sp. AM07-16]